ncbi:MAG: AI-2E family transporter [Terriglobia bacterium]
MPETKFDQAVSTFTSSTSLRVIAAAIVFICLYYASSVVITLICAILIAFVLDPGVVLLERLRLPRWLGSLLMVLLALGVVYLLIYLIYNRATTFVQHLPAFMAKIKQITEHFQNFFSHIRQSTSSIASSPESSLPAIRVQQESGWTRFLMSGIGSIYAFTVTVMFIPFLVFFMLTAKRHLYFSTISLFPVEHRQQAEDIVNAIGQMIREYVFGNFLVAVISMALITPAYLAIHLRYAFILGALSAIIDLIPYIGVALATLPPLLVALMQFNKATPIIVIAITVAVVHFISMNILTPKLVGGRVRLNALAVTIAMMFWGWLWGAMGLILAVPIMAAVKAVCDNIPSLKSIGYWLGEGS